MSFEIFHQGGHNFVWNKEIFSEDGVGDGFILSPRHLGQEKIEGLSSEIKNRSIFDPQFFEPRFSKGQLISYDFHPQSITDGFETSKYSGTPSVESAYRCVEFQKAQNFPYIVIPTRCVRQMPTDYIEVQESLFVRPFLNACEGLDISKPILLQLVVNVGMLLDEAYANRLLDWITGLSEIAGIYLIIQDDRRSKQIKDPNDLIATLNFIHQISVVNQMEVVCGYLNLEAIVYSIASPTILTIGTYENTRLFRIRNFEDSESPPHGPTPRIYMTKLLQLVDNNFKDFILKEAGDIFDKNRYQVEMFVPDYRWWFSKPQPYKHFMLEFSNQLQEIAKHSGQDRYKYVNSIIREAYAIFGELDGILFDANSDGSHLPYWATAISGFAKAQGWR